MSWSSGKSVSALTVLLLIYLFSCRDPKPVLELHRADYICPMRCEGEKTYPAAGQCPVCHMNLEPSEEDLIQVVSPAEQVLSNQTTVKMLSSDHKHFTMLTGFIDRDIRRDVKVASRVNGRIEKLFVKYDRQYVKKGDKIMEIYSPELNTAAEQHLFLLKNGGDPKLIGKSREKLIYMGLSVDQINVMEKNGTVSATVSVYSSVTGFIDFSISSGKAMLGQSGSDRPMDNMSMTPDKNTPAPVKESNYPVEGMYISQGQTLFVVNDLQKVWAMLSIPGGATAEVNNGEIIHLHSEVFPDRILEGKVLITEQFYEEQPQRFVRLRVEMDNSGKDLLLNSGVMAEIEIRDAGGHSLPASAVWMSGVNSYVWVKRGITKNGTGIFILRKVVATPSVDGRMIILEGLTGYEEVAEQAGLMTDSETLFDGN